MKESDASGEGVGVRNEELIGQNRSSWRLELKVLVVRSEGVGGQKLRNWKSWVIKLEFICEELETRSERIRCFE